MTPKKITVFAGHYGSGKTQIAVNYALWLRKRFPKVTLADLDVINPYYRTSDSAELLRENDVRIITSNFAGSNVDLPSIPAEIQSVFDDPEAYGVLDVGGNDSGALALGRYAAEMRKIPTDIWLVVNRFRFHTRDEEGVLYMMRDIESAAHVKFNGLVNNSNVGSLTAAEDIVNSEGSYAQTVAEMCGLPLVMTTIEEQFYDQVAGLVTSPFPIKLYTKEYWKY